MTRRQLAGGQLNVASSLQARQDDLERQPRESGARADVHQAALAHDADTVHLADDFATKARQPAVTLIATGAHQVLRVVAQLHHADAELLEDLDIAQLVFERMGVLEAENDPGLALLLGAIQGAVGALDQGGDGQHRQDHGQEEQVQAMLADGVRARRQTLRRSAAPAPRVKPFPVMLIAGEPSGDVLAAAYAGVDAPIVRTETPVAEMALPIRIETRTGDTPAARRRGDGGWERPSRPCSPISGRP